MVENGYIAFVVNDTKVSYDSFGVPEKSSTNDLTWVPCNILPTHNLERYGSGEFLDSQFRCLVDTSLIDESLEYTSVMLRDVNKKDIKSIWPVISNTLLSFVRQTAIIV